MLSYIQHSLQSSPTRRSSDLSNWLTVNSFKNDSIFQYVFGKEAVSISWTASKSSISICLTTCSVPSNFFPPPISSNIPAPGNEYLLFPVQLQTAQPY